MRKFVTLLLTIVLLIPAAASASAGLAEAQQYIYETAPQYISDRLFVINGTIVDTFYTSNSHKVLLITVEDNNARKGIEYDYDLPCCKAIFPYHYEFDMPISIGEEITIIGSINSFYSTVMNPSFTIKTINGDDVSDWMYENVYSKEEP